MKIAVIGGGSTYTPELIKGFMDRVDRLPVEEIFLMDIDPSRLQVVGSFAQRLVKQANLPMRVVLSEDSQQAIAGADVVITQLRVGQMPARREDERRESQPPSFLHQRSPYRGPVPSEYAPLGTGPL